METKIRLAMQSALNGWVGEETRLVEARWTRNSVNIIVYTEGRIDDALAVDLDEQIDRCLTPILDPEWTGGTTKRVDFVRLDDPAPISIQGIAVFVKRSVQIAYS